MGEGVVQELMGLQPVTSDEETSAAPNTQELERTRRHELAVFLRARRDSLQPADVGLTLRGRRQVKGLRREEVAMQAGVSLTWYTWLEQGREIHVTPMVLDAIARTLLLNEAQRAYLFRLGDVAYQSAEESRSAINSLLLRNCRSSRTSESP